jgi:hypothetical protein
MEEKGKSKMIPKEELLTRIKGINTKIVNK